MLRSHHSRGLPDTGTGLAAAESSAFVERLRYEIEQAGFAVVSLGVARDGITSTSRPCPADRHSSRQRRLSDSARPTSRRAARGACSAWTALSLAAELPRGRGRRTAGRAAPGGQCTRSDFPSPNATWNSTSTAFLTLIGAFDGCNLRSETLAWTNARGRCACPRSTDRGLRCVTAGPPPRGIPGLCDWRGSVE
jgi:hypothetical protein